MRIIIQQSPEFYTGCTVGLSFASSSMDLLMSWAFTAVMKLYLLGVIGLGKRMGHEHIHDFDWTTRKHMRELCRALICVGLEVGEVRNQTASSFSSGQSITHKIM